MLNAQYCTTETVALSNEVELTDEQLEGIVGGQDDSDNPYFLANGPEPIDDDIPEPPGGFESYETFE